MRVVARPSFHAIAPSVSRIQDRMHILDGFLTILADIDEVIKTIKSSKTRETALSNLRKKWKLSVELRLGGPCYASQPPC